MDLTVQKAASLKAKQPDQSLIFGTTFTDHMFVMDYEIGKGWRDARIVPYGDIVLDPAAVVLHYGQTIFEGMKAFRQENGKIALYRPLDHLNRLNKSAEIVCIPPIDVDFAYRSLRQLIELEKDWVPASPGTSLYIRPFVVATEPYLGVGVSKKYTYYVILSPVGPYYAAGFNPVKIKVEDKYVRAVKGGLGEAKTAGNYTASLKAAQEAKEQHFDQVLWLDAKELKYVEEVGTMNIFFKIGDELVTPELNGSILDGITRRSILHLTRAWGLKVSERRISIAEVFASHARGQLKEVFGTGTAAIISPVGELNWQGKTITINNNQTGELAQKLFDTITGIQQGTIEDKFNWIATI
ncbi:MAG: branched-chain amino acid aminotransferase [Sporomusaceae bacterium]|jgi:branched-chain amino acid aminotransferase|nr:branched-chain amino acid aminotransferase [Sporomusaceae bacterium]